MQGSVLVKRMAVGCVLGVIAGLGASLLAPKIYEARAEIWIQGDDAARQAHILGNQLTTQLELLKSEGVYASALHRVSLRNGGKEAEKKNLDLYKMYNVDAKSGSSVATVRVRAYDPNFAASMANEIALTYRVLRAQANNTAEAARQQGFLARIDQAKEELESAEQKLENYKAQTGSPDLNQTTQQTLAYEANLTSRLDAAKSELSQTIREMQTLGKQIKLRPRQIITDATRAPNSAAQAIQNQLDDLQRQRIDALRTFTETSSKVRGIDAAIADAQGRLEAARNKGWETREQREQLDPQRQQLEQQYSQKMAQAAALNAEIGNLNTYVSRVQREVRALPSAQSEMQRLERNYQMSLSRYNTLEDQLTTRAADLLPANGTAVTLKNASPDNRPVSPNVPLLLLLGGMLGILGGGIYAYATYREVTPVRTADDLQRLGLSASTVMGLPRRREEQMLRALPDPSAKPAEAYKFMALTMPPGDGVRKIMFTGVGSDSGCSSAAGQFALAVAYEGRPTLLVDCDFRQSSLSHVFDSTHKPGLSDILRRTLLPSQDNEISMGTQHQNLLFLPTGSSGDGSIADFSHTQLRAAMEMLSDRADVIVLDAPPCDVVTDAVRLAPLVDIVYLVVSADDTESSKVNMAHQMLRRCGARDVQIMLTGGDPSSAPFTAA